MTEAEIMELINIKRHTLEEYRTAKPAVSNAALKVLEDEIKTLEISLAKASSAPKRPGEKKVFLDECAG
jgi:hypothetical protein